MVNETGTSIADGVGALCATPLRAWVTDGVLYIKGLPIGQTYRIFTLSGVLIYQGIATGDPVETRLIASLQSGTYIIHSEIGVVKVVW
jgi:hypothetical protein